jgi:hypothetical protein
MPAAVAEALRPIEALVGADGYGMVLGRYGSLLAALRDGRLGGAIIHAVSA